MYSNIVCIALWVPAALWGAHAMLSDVLIQHIGLIQDFIDRVLQVQDSGLIMPVKGVGS